jgi:hypothetical protein
VGRQHRQTIECPLRSQLLRDSYEGVDRQDHTEEAVLEGSDEDNHNQQRSEDGIESGENIRPQNLRDRPATLSVGRVDPAGGDPLGNLLIG